MADLGDVAADVKQLKHDVHVQGNILKLMMYSQATEFTDKVVTSLVNDPVLLSIYVGVDGLTTRDDLIRKVVDMNLPNGKRASVYAKFNRLEDLGVIEPIASPTRSVIFRKSAISEGLRIEQHADFVKAVKSRRAAR